MTVGVGGERISQSCETLRAAVFLEGACCGSYRTRAEVRVVLFKHAKLLLCSCSESKARGAQRRLPALPSH